MTAALPKTPAIVHCSPMDATGVGIMDHDIVPLDAVPRMTKALPSDVEDALALIEAFVAVLLAERAGPLTPEQQDLLLTIQAEVARALDR